MAGLSLGAQLSGGAEAGVTGHPMSVGTVFGKGTVARWELYWWAGSVVWLGLVYAAARQA